MKTLSRDFDFLRNFNDTFFIAIDGPNCSGKTTLLRHISNELESEKIPHDVMVEPRNGGFVRTQIVENPNPIPRTQTEIMNAFMTERDENIREYYIPAMLAGRHIICSRHLKATHVYQGDLGGLGSDTINALYTKTLAHPDVVAANFANRSFHIVLWLDEETALARQNARASGDDIVIDNLERKTADEIAAYGRRHFDAEISVDARGTPAQIMTNVATAVRAMAQSRRNAGLIR